MAFDKELIAGKLRRWERYLMEYHLPQWDSIPDIGLYMEQVLLLLKEYLDYLPPELRDEESVTSATINNYVRKKYMPEPYKKKYYRLHIVYLIIICSLKQSLSLTTLHALLPADMKEEDLKRFYESYVLRHRQGAEYFLEQTRDIAGGILDHKERSDMTLSDTADLITFMTVVSGYCKLLAEKLILLEGKTVQNGGSIEVRSREERYRDLRQKRRQ